MALTASANGAIKCESSHAHNRPRVWQTILTRERGCLWLVRVAGGNLISAINLINTSQSCRQSNHDFLAHSIFSSRLVIQH